MQGRSNLLIRENNCKNCNKIYIPNSNNSKYCSISCSNKFHYKKKFPNRISKINKKFNCLICNTVFINKSHNQKKYCSSSCKCKDYRKGKTYKNRYKKYIKSESFKNSQEKYRSSEHGLKKIKELRKKYQNILNFKARTIYRKTEKGRRLCNYHCALRYSRKRQRTPKWLTKEDLFKIKQFYLKRPQGYEVDHIIPLCGDNVSGLHVLNNLQYLKAQENREKNNKYTVV